MTKIHPTAVVDKAAELDESVEVGPYTVIGPDVQIGAGCWIGSSVMIDGCTTIGRNNRIYTHAVLGLPPQDKVDRGKGTRLEIGDDNTIREFCTINTGTERGGGVTRVGSDNLLMIASHMGHDTEVQDNTIISNCVLLAGHVKVESNVVISGGTAINQFVTVGQLAYIGGLTRVVRDVPPFLITEGNPQRARSVNAIGMQRNGYSEEAVARIREAYRVLFDPNLPMSKAVIEIEGRGSVTPEVRDLIDCLRRRQEAKSGRALEALRQT